MTHEPECLHSRFAPSWILWCMCDELRVAYQRGREDAAKAVERLYATTDCTWENAVAAARGESAE